MKVARWTLEELEQATSGTVLSRRQTVFEQGFSTDSRTDLRGSIFVALRGGRHDGHAFLADAVTGGAQALIVDQEPSMEVLQKATVIRVADTLLALQDLARFYRRRLSAKVIGITGSNGKTSTKEFAAALTAPYLRSHWPQGSFNNHWGVPLTILSAPSDTQALILEMGMNHLHEIERLVQIAEPDIAVCTMVGTAHIGELGSQANIAKAKSEIYFTRPKMAVQIFNLDNEWTRAMWEKAKELGQAEKLVTYSSFDESADIFLRAETMSGFALQVSGAIFGVRGAATVPIFGRHNVVNLMAASAVAVSLGLKPEGIWLGLKDCRSAWGRGQVLKSPGGATILFDAYNANPESMAALIRNTYEASIPGQKGAVLGEMLELGEISAKAHFELGALVARANLDWVWFLGPHAADFEAGLKSEGFQKNYFISNSYDESLATSLGAMLHPTDIVLVKGSRGMKLERVLKAWGVPIEP